MALLQSLGRCVKVTTVLQPTSTGAPLRVSDSALVIADGPFAETKEQILGAVVVDRRELDQALEVAAPIPSPVWAG